MTARYVQDPSTGGIVDTSTGTTIMPGTAQWQPQWTQALLDQAPSGMHWTPNGYVENEGPWYTNPALMGAIGLPVAALAVPALTAAGAAGTAAGTSTPSFAADAVGAGSTYGMPAALPGALSSVPSVSAAATGAGSAAIGSGMASLLTSPTANVIGSGIGAGANIYGAKLAQQTNEQATAAQMDYNNRALAAAQAQQQWENQFQQSQFAYQQSQDAINRNIALNKLNYQRGQYNQYLNRLSPYATAPQASLGVLSNLLQPSAVGIQNYNAGAPAIGAQVPPTPTVVTPATVGA